MLPLPALLRDPMPGTHLDSIILASSTGIDGRGIHLAWSIPFVLLLACTAVLPLVNKHFWERFYWAVALGLGAVAAGYYVAVAREPERWLHAMTEYVSFIVLLASLY